MMNIKRILCPTDLTPHSEHAVRYAIALARVHEAELTFLFCDVGSVVDEDRRAELELVLVDQIDVSDLLDVRWRLVVAPAEEVGEEIVRQAQTERIDLIIMRSRRRPHRAALLGSTAESVCRSAPCPVLVTHNDERESLRDG